MNKKFTMVCASLLLASAFSVNAQAAELQANPIVISAYTAADAVEIAEGVKFYLNNGSNYYQVASATTKDKKEVVTLGGKIIDDVTNASIFEIRNAQKNGNGYIVELYVDGKSFVVESVYSGGQQAVAATDGKNLSELTNKFYIASKTTSFDSFSTAEIPTQSIVFGTGWKGAKASLTYNSKNLFIYNNEGTTFSFDFSDDELVGNFFKELTPVTIGNSTYFLKGEKASEFDAATPAKIKGLQILAIDNKNDYDLNSSKAGEGLKLRMVDAEKFLLKDGALISSSADSLLLAGFTSILEADHLNNAKELVLTMSPTEKALGIDMNSDNDKTDNEVYDFNIAAVKTSATDTKAYVTTVKAGENASSWAVVKNALLGDNTYFAASEFLKEGMRAVAVLNITGEAGDDNYYKYIVEQAGTYKAASEIDFEMAQSQWVVTNFDGKYGLTLTNRLDNSQTLSFTSISKTDKGYKATLNGGTTIEFKLLDLSTTQTDGYMELTEAQLEEGIKLSFYGETALAGEKEFFVTTNEDVNAFVPVLDASKTVLVSAEAVETPVKNVLTYACLNAEGKMTTANDTLYVPAYTFKVADKSIENAFGHANTTVAFAKNMNGSYSVAAINGLTTLTTISNASVAAVTYNPTGTSDNNEFSFSSVSRYDANAVVGNFAQVKVSPKVVLNTSLPTVPGHYTFDNERGSINVKDLVGINEGFLASEGQVFWLDTADIEKATPSFYISFGKDSVAARNYMFNPIDSAKVFDEFTASYKYNKEYYYGEDAKEGKGTLKAAFASAVAEEGKDLADAFKFNITLKDAAVADEYVISSVKDSKLFVSQINGVVVLDDCGKENAMAFTVNKAEAPTSNESVVASEVKVVANNGSVVVKNAAGKNVVVSTILGQVVANEVLTSDNATINVPAGIVVVAVDGESFKVSVK